MTGRDWRGHSWFSAPAAGAGLSQERGPVSTDQRQHWRHFSTTPVGPRGAFHVLSCCRDSPVIHSVHFHFHVTSFQSHLSKITVATCKRGISLDHNIKKCELKENEENRRNRNFYRTKRQNHHPDPFGPGLGKPDALSFQLIETADRSDWSLKAFL